MIRIGLIVVLMAFFARVGISQDPKPQVKKPSKAMVLRANTRDRMIIYRKSGTQIHRQMRFQKAIRENREMTVKRMQMHRKRKAIQQRNQQQMRRQMIHQRRIQQQRMQRPRGGR